MKRTNRPLGAAVVLFVASRLFLLYGFTPLYSDVPLYATYAWQHVQAKARGETVYQLRAEEYAQAALAAKLGLGAPPLAGSGSVEYPPLALAVILLPEVFMAAPASETFLARYIAMFRAMMAVADGLGFVMVIWLARRLFPRQRPWELAARATTYTAGGLLLGHLLYDRLDVVLSTAVAVSLALLLYARRPVFFLSALAVAIHLKLVPALLVPVFILASVDREALGDRSGRARWLAIARDAAGKAALLVAIAGILLVPFYVAWGPACLRFLRYHGVRGVQVESTYASLLFVLGGLGLPTKVVLEYGAADVLSPLSGLLGRLSPVAVAGVTAAIAWVLARRVARAPRDEASTVIWYLLATLLAAVATSKVLSAQYFIWLLPMLALLPDPATGRRHALLVGYLAICALTTAIFPYLYFDHIVGMIRDPATGGFTSNYSGPTMGGKVALWVRNLGLVLLAAAIWVRRGREQAQ